MFLRDEHIFLWRNQYGWQMVTSSIYGHSRDVLLRSCVNGKVHRVSCDGICQGKTLQTPYICTMFCTWNGVTKLSRCKKRNGLPWMCKSYLCRTECALICRHWVLNCEGLTDLFVASIKNEMKLCTACHVETLHLTSGWILGLTFSQITFDIQTHTFCHPIST